MCIGGQRLLRGKREALRGKIKEFYFISSPFTLSALPLSDFLVFETKIIDVGDEFTFFDTNCHGATAIDGFVMDFGFFKLDCVDYAVATDTSDGQQ